MNTERVWLCSTSEDSWTNGEELVSREEAIDCGHRLAEEEQVNHFWVGTKEEFTPHLSAELVIEWISEQAYEVAGEWSEGWPSVNRNEENDLDEKLNEVLSNWIKETSNSPKFFIVGNSEQIEHTLSGDSE